jgi:hypothetical protein
MECREFKVEVDDKEYRLINKAGKVMVSITNEGKVIMNISQCSYDSYAIDYFFRETLGKRIHINWRRHNYTIIIYPENGWWRQGARYRRTDLDHSVAVFDLTMTPISGLRKLPPPPQRDEYGQIIRKTTSEW